MMKNKKFDCVKMKWEIQQQIANEYSGLSDEQTHQRQLESIKNNPLLKKFANRLAVSPTSSKTKKHT